MSQGYVKSQTNFARLCLHNMNKEEEEKITSFPSMLRRKACL